MTGLPERLLAQRNEVRSPLGTIWWKALLFALGNWLFDYFALLAAITATGSHPRPTLVLLAYSAAMVLAMIPITPGGLGFVEAGLTGLLALAGVGAANAGDRRAGLPTGVVLASAAARWCGRPGAPPALPRPVGPLGRQHRVGHQGVGAAEAPWRFSRSSSWSTRRSTLPISVSGNDSRNSMSLGTR